MSSQSVGRPLVSSVASVMRRSPALAAHAVPVALYLLTLVFEVPGALARVIIVVPPVAAVLAVTGQPIEPALTIIGYSAALFPLLWSVLALIYPLGTGWLWRASSGGREPSARERWVYEDAIAMLVAENPGLRPPRHWFVLDQGDTNAAVLGSALMIHRGLFGGPWLEPILAHELGHLYSSDGRVSAALGRTIIFQPAYRPAGLLGVAVRLAFGGASLRVLRPAWGAWWRHREYAADLYAARLGQGEALARCLQAEALPYDFPVRFMALGAHSHPYTELRIDRLHSYEDRSQAELDAWAASLSDEEHIQARDWLDRQPSDRQDPQP